MAHPSTMLSFSTMLTLSLGPKSMPIPLKRIANTQNPSRTQMVLIQHENVRDPLEARGFELMTVVLPFQHAFAAT